MKYLLILGVLLAILAAVLVPASKSLYFSHKIVSALPASVMWRHLMQALKDSEKSPIWPNKLEELRASSVGVDAQINSIMYIFGTPVQAKYKITKIIEEKQINFAPLNPVYQGEDSIQIIPIDNGSILKWSGEYKTDSFNLGILYFKFYYLDKFFKDFENLIHTESKRRSSKLNTQ